jgi:putative lipoprotein
MENFMLRPSFLTLSLLLPLILVTACDDGKKDSAAEQKAAEVVVAPVPVLNDAAPLDSAAPETPATRVLYMCGEKEVRLILSSAGPELILDDGVSYALQDVVSASGVKYEAVDKPGLTFWSKGNTALITLDGQDWPECIAKTADAGTGAPVDVVDDVKVENPAQITGITWLLEDLNDGGIIDSSHMTLLLDDAGNASGHSGCNRYTAGYELKDATLSIKTNAAMTMMACAPALMEQEQRFVDALVLMSAYHFDETGALILSGEDKTLKFRVEAQEVPVAPQEMPAP